MLRYHTPPLHIILFYFIYKRIALFIINTPKINPLLLIDRGSTHIL